ncbi:MAG: 2-C-methyl-D-erythritol 4-phosphate cytidylyltransferase [Ilumatobacteraceae bacterium]
MPRHGTENVWTIVVAGGSSHRFGRPKQYEPLGGSRVIDHSVRVARLASDGVVLVVPAADVDAEGGVAGGSTRSESVRNGLAAVPQDATIICVHDAARPFADVELYDAVVAAVADGADCAVPGVAVVDTVKLVDAANTVISTPDRATMRSVQTPQAFRAAVLRQAHATGAEATDDAALVEAIGGIAVVVAGDERNRKITYPADLDRADATMPEPNNGAPNGVAPIPVTPIRVGQGFDIHRFSDDGERALILGGVVFDGERGLHGHSDADVVAHAVTDALLGAAGLGDIGQHFPDTDAQWKGADSLQLLRHAAGLLAAAGWMVGNVDCSVVCEQPKLAQRRDEMQQRLSAAAGAPVTVTGRRAEGLGALGRREGIACWAVAVIQRDGRPDRE